MEVATEQHQGAAHWLRADPTPANMGLGAGGGGGGGGGEPVDGVVGGGVGAPGAGACMTASDMFFHSSMDTNANHVTPATAGYYSTHTRAAMHSYRPSPSQYTPCITLLHTRITYII